MHHDESHFVESKTLFGFWLYLLSDIILFAVMFATYAVLRTGTAGGIGPGELISLPKALAETLLLLVSAFILGLSQRKDKNQTLVIVGVTFLLGLVFLALVYAGLATLVTNGNGWQRSAFLSSYFFLVGALLMHMTAALLWMVVLMGQIWQRGITPSTQRRLLCLCLFWHFLNIVWMSIYSWVYLIGAA